MKRYYVDGNEISESEAEGILALNALIMESENFEELANCKFVSVVNAA